MLELPDPPPAEPLALLADWLVAARAAEVLPNPDAMALATTGADGRPSVRIVLCKALVQDPGYLVFYSNYRSAKGAALAANSSVGVNFHWDVLNRQVRIEGHAVRSPAAESDAYFASRDRDSQLGAWASAQSESVASRAALAAAQEQLTQQYAGQPVPRPPHWGGYRIWIRSIELWARGAARLHDRIRWTRDLDAGAAGTPIVGPTWQQVRLQP